MKLRATILTAALAAGILLLAPAVRGESIIWHDPYLNWDLTNWTGAQVNDLSVWVDNPNGKFNPNVNDPMQMWADIFTTVVINPTGAADHDGDGDLDTEVKYMNPIGGIPVAPGGTAHGGIYMLGSGRVIDAYWTWNCNKVGNSIPVTYEKTEIRGDPEVHMHLQICDGYFEDSGGTAEAGWTEIRTFVNLPADLLDLPDLNKDLDLTALAAYEVIPEHGQPGLPGTTGVPILPGDTLCGCPPESFFDVYLGIIPPENASPEFEALLVATVIGTNPLNPDENVVHGQFWNLNPQSPEPCTLLLLGLGAVGLLRRRGRGALRVVRDRRR